MCKKNVFIDGSWIKPKIIENFCQLEHPYPGTGNVYPWVPSPLPMLGLQVIDVDRHNPTSEKYYNKLQVKSE